MVGKKKQLLGGAKGKIRTGNSDGVNPCGVVGEGWVHGQNRNATNFRRGRETDYG